MCQVTGSGHCNNTQRYVLISVHAQQQQYANAYTYWDFGQGSDDVQNVEQKNGLPSQHPLHNG